MVRRNPPRGQALNPTGSLYDGSRRRLLDNLTDRIGRDYVVLLAADDLRSIGATLELLTDTAAQRRVDQAAAELVAGHMLSRAEASELVSGRGGRHRR